MEHLERLDGLNLSASIKKQIREWLKEDYDAETRNEISRLIADKNEKELLDRFFMDLEFGTGGLRGVMGAGSNRMNKYNIWKATQGLSNYLIRKYKKNIKAVIAYDSRRNSKEFALETALVFGGNGIMTYLFPSLRPTPVLSFCVRYLKAQTGIVITASHNPPEYNGYKVYAPDGGQVISPEDKEIIRNVRKITDIRAIKRLTEEDARKKGMLVDAGYKEDEAYLLEVKKLSLNPEIIQKVSNVLKIVYTPIHGSGNIPVRSSLKSFGFRNVFVVPEQERPDGNFPTVKSPNPEEASSLELGLKLCREKDADILLATDPDSDRLGVAVKNKNSGYDLLTGNQIVSLLTHYILSQLKEKGRLPKNGLIIKTIVTTDLMKRIADDFQVRTMDVLTGFKYIGEQIKINERLKQSGKPFWEYIFGGEESYGMLAGTFVRDKDAVSASSLFAEMAAFLKHRNSSTAEYLDDIFRRYGYHKEILKSLTLKGMEGISRIKAIMDVFRNKPPDSIGSLKIRSIGDIQKNRIINTADKKVLGKYDLPRSDVLVLMLDEDIKITMRPSGTEPKIKFYFAASGQAQDDLEGTKKRIDERIDRIRDDLMQTVQAIIAVP
ncbi:MAG: phospho-sugar mutase [bacterium]|nr:phospho-sugar mutase [bacterium]